MDLRATIKKYVYILGQETSHTPLKKVPGVKNMYSILINTFGNMPQEIGTDELPSEETWIQCDGYYLLIYPRSVIGKLLYMGGEHEGYVRRVFEERVSEGDVAFDIGAHWGYHSLYLSQLVGSSGKVYLFEPSPKNVHFLEQSLKRSNIRNAIIIQKAVFNRSHEKIKLYLFLDTNMGANTILEGHSGSSISGELQCEAIRLDDFIDENAISVVDFIKVDVEGAELYAIESLGPKIHQVKHLLVEVHRNHLTKDEIKSLFQILSNRYKNLHRICHYGLHLPVDSPNKLIGHILCYD